MSSVAKDRLVLSQYDLHHGSFLLVTPLVMSSYKMQNYSLKKHLASVACFTRKAWFKVKKIPTLPPCVEELMLAVKSLGSDFPQALSSVLPLSFVHLPIVLSDSVLAYPAPGRYM